MPTWASTTWTACSSDPTCDSRSRTSWTAPLAPFSDERMPVNPIVTDKAMRTGVYTRPPAVTTRDWVTFSEPFLFSLITSAVACLAVLLAKSPPERRDHVLGRVAVLEAREDHKVFRRINFRRHPRIIPRFELDADGSGYFQQRRVRSKRCRKGRPEGPERHSRNVADPATRSRLPLPSCGDFEQ
jgi:hypothetical protein